MMRITNHTSFVQVFGAVRLQPGQCAHLDDAWAPRLRERIAKGSLTVSGTPDPKPDPKMTLVDLADESPVETQMNAYRDSHYQTRIKFVKSCSDLHVLEVIQEHEKNEKIQKLVASQISHLKANSEENL